MTPLEIESRTTVARVMCRYRDLQATLGAATGIDPERRIATPRTGTNRPPNHDALLYCGQVGRCLLAVDNRTRQIALLLYPAGCSAIRYRHTRRELKRIAAWTGRYRLAGDEILRAPRGMTLAEIGMTFGVTKQAVAKHWGRGVLQLAEEFMSHEL